MTDPPGPATNTRASLPTVAADLARNLGEPLLGGNRLRLLFDGSDVRQTLHQAIGGARDHINADLEFIAATGPGDELVDALAERSRSGVCVNLLCAGTCERADSPWLERLRVAGVRLGGLNRPGWLRRRLLRLRHEGRRRLLIVDGRTAFIGGIARPEGSDSVPGWINLHLQLQGPAVHRLQRVFLSQWQLGADMSMPQARYFPPLATVDTQRVGVGANDTDRHDDTGLAALIAALGKSRQNVLLAMDRADWPASLQRSLLDVVRRGVMLELHLPLPASRRALSSPRGAFGAQAMALRRAGAAVHERAMAWNATAGRREAPKNGLARIGVIDSVWVGIDCTSTDGDGTLLDRLIRRISSVLGLRRMVETHLVVFDEGLAAEVAQALRLNAAQVESAPPTQFAAAVAALPDLPRKD